MLLIGNGFDLNHGLPTKYSDFVYFALHCFAPNYHIKDNRESMKVFNDKCRNYFKVHDRTYEPTKVEMLEQYKKCLYGNWWIEYFAGKLGYNTQGIAEGDNIKMPDNSFNDLTWIDFEKEIKSVILLINKIIEEVGYDSMDYIQRIINGSKSKYANYFKILPGKIDEYNTMIIKDYLTYIYVPELFKQLELMSHGLELYLSDFISDYCNIENNKQFVLCQDLKNCSYDAIINFNYTDTANKLFANPAKTIYIHGRAYKNTKNSDLVLGTDDIFEDEYNISFIEFEKRHQRIVKGTDLEWRAFIDYIYNLHLFNKGQVMDLYIFGHSLDQSDDYILKQLLDSEKWKTRVHIYCYNESERNKFRGKMIHLIGYDELGKKIHEGKVEFILQKDVREDRTTIYGE